MTTTYEALRYKDEDCITDFTAEAAYTGGEVIQTANGRAAIVPRDVASGAAGVAESEGIFTVAKTTSMVILDGGKVYWDHSANKAHYKAVSDRDFYIGTAVGDAASADTTMKVRLNAVPVYAVDIMRDPITSVIAGTAAAGGFGYPRTLGGSMGFYITATSEAQKVDALSVDGFTNSANAIVEMALRFPTGGSGSASDYNVGIASGTHATDADSIAQHLFAHFDGASTNINFQSKDGSTTVTSTDSTIDYTAAATQAARVEIWFDCRTTTSVKVYVDGARVLSGTTFDVSAAASTWLLLAHAEKTTGTETGDMIVDWLRARIAQQ